MSVEISTDNGANPHRVPDQFLNNSHRGKISVIAAKKITRAIDYLVYLAQPKKLPHTLHGKGLTWRVNFITLTLSSPQIHSDNEIKSNLLEPFLNTMRQRWKVINYIWRAEKQANGNLHFHIISDKFIPWSELRDVWNALQQKLGYVSRYRENQLTWHKDGFRYRPELAKTWPRSKQLKAYKAGIVHDWHNPNSTDVHSLRQINNVRAYFIKYLTKSYQSTNIDGRLWGCSYALSNVKGARGFAEGRISTEIDQLLQMKGVKKYESQYFTAIYFDSQILQSGLLPEISEIFEAYLSELFPAHRPPGLFRPARAA